MENDVSNDFVFVRVRPHNPRKGQRVRTRLVFGIRFEEKRGWYKVPRTTVATINNERRSVDVPEYLKSCRNDDSDPDSSPVFDVCDEIEARKIMTAEKKAKELARERGIDDANTVDLSALSVTRPARESREAAGPRGARPHAPSAAGAAAEEAETPVETSKDDNTDAAWASAVTTDHTVKAPAPKRGRGRPRAAKPDGEEK